MSSSEARAPLSGNQTDEETVLIDIYEKLPIEETYHNNGFHVCRVPRSFHSTKAEAFTPQFVGLGSYHHFDTDLPMTNEFKLGVAKRVLSLKVSDIGDVLHRLVAVSEIQIQAFYSIDDVPNTCDDSRTPHFVLTVDALFLLGLLHGVDQLKQRDSCYYILTGKRYGMPPVNASNVELTMDGIARDVFMLENQVPAFVLKHISSVVNTSSNDITEIQSGDDLGSAMLNFCEAHSPFVVSSGKLSKATEDHHHLLDLMYNLIAPEPQPQQEPKHKYNRCLLLICCPMLIFLLLLRFLEHLLCLVCIIFFCISYVILRFVQPFLLVMQILLVKVIPWLGSIFRAPERMMPTLPHFFGYLYIFLFDHLSSNLPIWSALFSNCGIYQWMDRWNASLSTSYKVQPIPSATELSNSLVFRLMPVDSDISSFKVASVIRTIYLPCIKLDSASEVIFRNLVVYESLIKRDRLNFTSYMKFMSGLIRTSEDVKLLVDKKIIQTQLSAEVVTQIFNIPVDEFNEGTLDEQFSIVKSRLDASINLLFILVEIVRVGLFCGIVVVFSPIIAEAFQKMWCSTVFGNSLESCSEDKVHNYPYMDSM